jgi:DNA-binding winged helix-turn-helix (wHTH) protein
MGGELRPTYAFGPFELDAGERQLRRDGVAVSLTPKSFDLLLVLIEHAGHLLEKEALLKAVWPDSFVEENNLADNISKLRKALGDGENGQRCIETVPKRAIVSLQKCEHESSQTATRPFWRTSRPWHEHSQRSP